MAGTLELSLSPANADDVPIHVKSMLSRALLEIDKVLLGSQLAADGSLASDVRPSCIPLHRYGIIYCFFRFWSVGGWRL